MKSISFLLLVFLITAGCATKPALKGTGFLGDYSSLTRASNGSMRYLSAELNNYHAFIVDPIVLKVAPQKLDAEDRAKVANYFSAKLGEILKKHNYRLVNNAGVGVARLRVAMTDIANSTWWQKIHPGMRLTGAGTGGAASEGEVIDSVTGQQVAAWIFSDSASQFDFTAFSTVADVQNVIDQWADKISLRLREMRDPTN